MVRTQNSTTTCPLDGAITDPHHRPLARPPVNYTTNERNRKNKTRLWRMALTVGRLSSYYLRLQ